MLISIRYSPFVARHVRGTGSRGKQYQFLLILPTNNFNADRFLHGKIRRRPTCILSHRTPPPSAPFPTAAHISHVLPSATFSDHLCHSASQCTYNSSCSLPSSASSVSLMAVFTASAASLAALFTVSVAAFAASPIPSAKGA